MSSVRSLELDSSLSLPSTIRTRAFASCATESAKGIAASIADSSRIGSSTTSGA